MDIIINMTPVVAMCCMLGAFAVMALLTLLIVKLMG